MSKDAENTDWLDEAFDDKKNEEEYLAAQKASNKGCLIGIIAALVILVAGSFIMFGGVAMLAFGS